MVLPEGLKFLELGWWIVHVIAVMAVYAWGYRRGRRDERRTRATRAEPPPDERP